MKFLCFVHFAEIKARKKHASKSLLNANEIL